MIFLALEILFLTFLAFGGGVFAGRLAYTISARAAAAANRSVTATPELDPEADIEDIYALFEPTEETAEPVEPEAGPEVAEPEAGKIPKPAPAAQVKFERLLKEARDSQKRQPDKPSS